MSGIRLEWAQFGNFNSFDVIKSDTSMANIADSDLPDPLAINLKTMYYVDTSVTQGNTYYYKVRAWRGELGMVSSEIKCLADNDKHWNNVVSLLHFDNNLIDEKGILSYGIVDSITFSSNAKFEKALDLSGRSGLLSVSDNSINLGSEDYTIESYINAASFTVNTIQPVIFSIGNNNNIGNQEVVLGIESNTGKLFYRVYQDRTYIINDIKSTSAITLNAWTHVAIVRNGLNHFIFINGVLSASYEVTNNYSLINRPVDLIIGGIISTGNNKSWGRFDGLIDEFRFTKGVARYVESFTPPNKPFLNN